MKMAELPIRIFGDPVLKEQCPEVSIIDGDIKNLVQDMIDSLPQPGGAGLSANQIGVVKRVFVYDNEGHIEACINPSVISVSEETTEEIEGCLSLPGVGVPVSRHLYIELEYMDLEGKKHQMKAEGWLARVFQHEIDHLNGKLILERTDRESRIEALQILEESFPPKYHSETNHFLL